MIRNHVRISLGLLSIEAAEELERLRLGREYKIESISELSHFFKESSNFIGFNQLIFSNAYFETYKEMIENTENIKQNAINISNKLNNIQNLKKEELEKLISFCVNFSDYSAVLN